jgi:hypothetical protein
MSQHDITKKLRAYTRHPSMGGNTTVPQALIDAAADEIERLRKALSDIVDHRPNESANIAITALHAKQ